MSRKRKGRSSNELNGSSFLMIRREVRESAAWFALPDDGRRLLDRLEIEHMRHGGANNGRLICPYQHFERYGLRKASLPLIIAQCETLGFLKVQTHGYSLAHGQKPANKYTLTYLEGCGDSPPVTDEWALIKDAAEANRRLAKVLAERGDKRRTHSEEIVLTRNIDSRRAGVPRM